MPISRLPEATARELASTLAITTPAAVVKELLDNAIDAEATFIDIIVSFDTLDRIEVRDNGHGISTVDLDSLGRTGYTSKITTFDDVMALGGKSLGFRGAALASINTVAEITLTTRTATDPVATMLQLSPGGGIARRRHVSAPVGTTVHVAKLFSRTPVREKVALGDAKKSLVAVKELLQAYALARPHVKLHLRVIRGDQSIPWSYNPKSQVDMRDTIVQLFGTELASGCAERAFPANRSPTVHDTRSSLIFESYLPHSFADATRISKRAFISVDSRPVSNTRGAMKKLYDIFKMHLSRAMTSLGQTEPPKSPFIRLNIQCEPRSYDPNIEPLKDDVLFQYESYIIEQFEQFMFSVYTTSPTSPETRAEATLLTPSSTGPLQINAPLVPMTLVCNSQGARIESVFTPTNPGLACRGYPSPDGGRNNPLPPTQAPSSSMTTSQPSSGLTLDREVVGEKRRFNGNPTPSRPPELGSPGLPVDRRGPSSVALSARLVTSEQSPRTQPVVMASFATRPNEESTIGKAIVHLTAGQTTASTEYVRNSTEETDQPRSHPVQLPPRPYPQHIQPSPSIPTGGVQAISNSQSRPFVVDMSACFVDSDDEERVPRRSAPRPSPQFISGDKRQEQHDADREDPLEGLNPWSIAKLTASRRRPRQPLPQPVVEEREEVGMSERTRQPLPAKTVSRQRQQCTSDIRGPSGKPPFRVSGGAYKKPRMGQPSSRGPKQPTVQTTLSRFRAPGHPGHVPVAADEGPRDSTSQHACSQPASSLAPLPKVDPRSRLFGDEQAFRNDAQRKLRRCKTDLLPLEKIPVGSETHRLRSTLRMKPQDLANMIDMIYEIDDYSREGEIERGLYDNIDTAKLQSLISRATALVGE